MLGELKWVKFPTRLHKQYPPRECLITGMRTRAGRFILKAMYTERVFGMHLFSNEYKPEVFWFRDIIPITIPAFPAWRA